MNTFLKQDSEVSRATYQSQSDKCQCLFPSAHAVERIGIWCVTPGLILEDQMDTITQRKRYLENEGETKLNYLRITCWLAITILKSNVLFCVFVFFFFSMLKAGNNAREVLLRPLHSFTVTSLFCIFLRKIERFSRQDLGILNNASPEVDIKYLERAS